MTNYEVSHSGQEESLDKTTLEVSRSLIKYPRTPYFRFSPSIGRDDLLFDESLLLDKELVITTKMDGSNVSLSQERCSSRSGESPDHASFDMLKGIHAGLMHSLPADVQLFGEWLYAKHSIHYDGVMALTSYLQIFAARDCVRDEMLAWTEVLELSKDLGLETVPELQRIPAGSTLDTIRKQVKKTFSDTTQQGHEGVVVRNVDRFPADEFTQNVAKSVRAGHVQTSSSWRYDQIVQNKLNKRGDN